MPLTREQVFQIFNQERINQAKKWPDHDGHKHTEHCLEMVSIYLRKAQDEWIKSSTEFTTWQQLAKIGACIVRALECGDETEILLIKGLR